ncbi:MAG: DUF362 domain-containing protein [Coriobacteriia bacterium]
MICINRHRDLNADEWGELVESVGALPSLLTAHSIAIKPNLAAGTYVAPKSHVISDLALLSSLIEFVHIVNPTARIYICESDSTGYGFAYAKFEHLGLPASLRLDGDAHLSVELLDLSRDHLVRVEDPRFLHFDDQNRQLWLSEKLVESSFRISLCNLKTHSVTGYTGACKNLFGCLPDADKSVMHPFIHEVVHDVTLALMPQLSIIDAFYGMERNGPVLGKPVDSGFRVVSDSPIEADLCAIKCAGLEERRVRYLTYLVKEGYFDLNDLPACEIPRYAEPAPFMRFMNRFGLTTQRFGRRVERFGHDIHAVQNFLTLVGVVLRPLLLRLFDIETLRRVNRKINR